MNGSNRTFLFACCAGLLTLAADGSAQPASGAMSSSDAPAAHCPGFIYRSKRDKVPVYNEADRSALVLRYLSQGEEICVVGKENGFSLALREPGKESAGSSSSGPDLNFVVETDLWEPAAAAGSRPRNALERVRSYYRYIQSGGVPEDALLPYRSLIGIFEDSGPKSGSSSSRNHFINGFANDPSAFAAAGRTSRVS
jgi:hypothetical protein